MPVREIKALKFGDENLKVAPKALNFFEVESEDGFYNALDSKTLKDGIHSFYVEGFSSSETGQQVMLATKVVNNTLYKIQGNLTSGDLTLKIKEVGQPETSVLLLANSTLKSSDFLFSTYLNARTSGYIPFSFRLFPGITTNILKIIYEYTLETGDGSNKRIIVFTYNKTNQTVTSLTLTQSVASGGDFLSFGGGGSYTKYYEGINDIYLLKAYVLSGQARQFLYAIKRNEVLMSMDDVYSGATTNPTVRVGLGSDYSATQSGTSNYAFPEGILKYTDNGVTYDVLNIINKSILISPNGKRILEKDKYFLGGNTFLDPRTTERKTYTYNYASNSFTLVSTIAANGLVAGSNTALSSFDEVNQKIYLLGYKDSSTISWFILDLNGNIVAQNTISGNLTGVFLTKDTFSFNTSIWKFNQNNTVSDTGVKTNFNTSSVGVSRFLGKNNIEYIMLSAYQSPGTTFYQQIFTVAPNGTISLYKTWVPAVPPLVPYNSFSTTDHAKARSFLGNDIIGLKASVQPIDIGAGHYLFAKDHNIFYENFENVLVGDFGFQDDNTSRAYVNNYSQALSNGFFNYSNNDFVAYFEGELYFISWDRKEKKVNLTGPKITNFVKSQIVISNAAILDL